MYGLLRMGWIKFAHLPGGTTVTATSFYEEVAGARVAIDAYASYGWLHAAAATDAIRHVCYADYSACISSRVRLKHETATPIFCFDGHLMSMKA